MLARFSKTVASFVGAAAARVAMPNAAFAASANAIRGAILGLMTVSLRARILVATIILSFPFAIGAIGLLAGDVPAFTLNDQVLACWIQLGVFGGAALGLATGRWWGGFLPLSMAWSSP
jgi:hypothetical protein